MGMLVQMKDERRVVERYELHAPAELRFDVGQREVRLLHLLTKNLSSGGVFVITDAMIPVGLGVLVQFHLLPEVLSRQAKLHRKARVVVKGEVLRAESDGIAIRFVSPIRMRSLPLGGTPNCNN
jgi:hypothetical protein